MVQLPRLLALPPTLLAFLLDTPIAARAQTQELEWPYNLPAHEKYYPEHESLHKRDLDIRRQLQQQSPVGLKKMSSDPGEKFFLDYWQFDGDTDLSQSTQIYSTGNVSVLVDLDAPLKMHMSSKHRIPILPRLLGRSKLFDKRDFECPAGSYACTDIGRDTSCCADGSTCQLVLDVGLGDVGCCPSDEVCGGSVSSCPSGGYTDCPQNPGGGCCLPGYACFEAGCVATSTAVVIVTPTPTSTSTSTRTSTSTTSSSPSPTSVSSTSSSTSSSTPPPTTTTPPPSTSTSSTPNTLICSSGFRSCPASLGGGCCPTDRACGRDVCPALSTTASFSAPGRPTSVTASTTTSLRSDCPTGFYACSAVYVGGCCQTGRDCDTTSCPAQTGITVVDGSTITVAAGTGSGITSVPALATGQCAGGWATCGTEVGGGCCPSGYGCGATACTITASSGATDVVGKVAPNEAGAGRESSWAALVVGVAFGIVFGGW